MKKAQILLILAFTMAIPKFLEQEYTLDTVVTQVYEPTEDIPEGMVVCSDTNDNEWAFYGSDDWLEGDIAELTMNDNGTAHRIDDDRVVHATYRGWVY